MESVMILFWLVYAVVMCSLQLALQAYFVVAYILEAKSLYAIANRRGIEKPWLAWVPVGSSWLLGCLSDQYRYATHGQVRNRRKLLMWLSIVLYAVLLLLLTVTVIWAVCAIASLVAEDPGMIAGVYIVGILAISWLLELTTAAATVYSVFGHMGYYDLYRSCDPGKSLIYLLVGIFASYPTPFFLYSCRNQDLGMPPRQDEEEPDTREEKERC